MTPEQAIDELRRLREQDPPTHGGRVLAYVYDSGRAELDEVAAEATRLFLPVNGLDPTTFRSVARLERDLVALARDVLHGDGDVVGSVTSGGTESCLLAVKSARDTWRAADPARAGVVPRLVVATTVHPAFHKAAHYLGLEVVNVSVDPATGVPSAAAMLDALDDRTALVVVSAPSYPYGVVDPVVEVAAGAAARGVACHVDACIGGWVLPWWPGGSGADAATEPWDLAVPGVTSISADLHKYGYTPKGASVVLYRGRERHRAQYFAHTQWPGYPVVNPTVLGSRAAGPMAAAWAVTRVLGDDGFADLVASTARATGRLVAALVEVRGLRVVGTPTGPLIAVATDGTVPPEEQVDPFLLATPRGRPGGCCRRSPAPCSRTGACCPAPATSR